VIQRYGAVRCEGPRRDGSGAPRCAKVRHVPPQVVAHRGASETFPEHTLAAYRHAIEVGADALECDVRLTLDGHLVCMHDRRVDRTSNGTGRVSNLELAHLEGLDWGSWKAFEAGLGPSAGDGVEQPDVEGPGDRSRLLTLRTLLGMVADSGRSVEVAIETKHPTRYGASVERAVVDVLQYFGWARAAPGRESPVRVMSFSLLAMRRMRELAPGVPLVFLMQRVPWPLRDGALPRDVAAAGIAVPVLRTQPQYPQRVHARGRQVHVWTVDEPADVDRCIASGVDAIITNRPEAVLRRLGR
jgi:glycerophosphoryl diester phosphodiesterase